MKLITREIDYAIKALCFMARSQDDLIPVPTLIKDLKIPRPFLRKILQRLHKKGILKASRGYGGGFTLALLPSKIFLVDLIKLFQGSLKLKECIFKKKICPDVKICKLKRKLDSIEKDVVLKLKLVTIASLIGGR